MIKQKPTSKKAWQKPEFRVLCRGESEENVLDSCKNHGSIFGSGPFGVGCTAFTGWFCNVNTNS